MTVEQTSRLLLLETSTRSGFVALAEGDAVVGERRLADSRRQARDLVPFVQSLLAERDWTPRDLTGVVVSIGPGSYTGLRVGLISARVLAYATGCVLLGVPTFAVLAAQSSFSPRVEVLADAQKDKVYHQAFRFEAENTPQPVSELAILPWEVWRANCPEGVTVTGPGALKFADRLPDSVNIAPEAAREPQAGSLLRLGLARLARGERDDPFNLDPLYLRPSSAEEQWEARK